MQCLRVAASEVSRVILEKVQRKLPCYVSFLALGAINPKPFFFFLVLCPTRDFLYLSRVYRLFCSGLLFAMHVCLLLIAFGMYKKNSSAARGSPYESPAARVNARTQDSFRIAAQNTSHLDLDNLSACVNALKLCLLICMSQALHEHRTGRQDTRTNAHLEYFHNEILGSCLNGEYGIRFKINFRAKF